MSMYPGGKNCQNPLLFNPKCRTVQQLKIGIFCGIPWVFW